MMAASSPYAPSGRNAYLKPRPPVPLAPVRKSSPLAVGFLCLLIQYWNDLNLRSAGQMKLLQLLRRQLHRVPLAFKPLAVSFLIWIEHKIGAVRLSLEPPVPLLSSRSQTAESTKSTPVGDASQKEQIKQTTLSSPAASKSSPVSDSFQKEEDKQATLTSSTGVSSPAQSWAASSSSDSQDSPHDEATNCEEPGTSSGPSVHEGIGGDIQERQSPDPEHRDSANAAADREAGAPLAARIRENRLLIHSVLAYWFGQGTPEQSQRKLWMISAGSPLRSQVDREISQQFGDLLVDLAHDNHHRWSDWTGCQSSNSKQAEDESDMQPLYKNDADCLYGFHGKVAAIVVLDQLSRHIWRHRQDHPQGCHLSNLPPQIELDRLAYRTAQVLVARHEPEIMVGMVPTPMYVFALMPFRHAGTLEAVQSVQERIAHMDVLVRDCDAMVRRFRNATNRRLAHLQDEQRRVGDPCLPSEFADADILEHSAFKACLATSRIHPVHQTITAFLAERGIRPLSKSSSLYSTSPATPVIISLSGGVDSMVIASVLSYLNDSCHYHLHLTAVHVDYGNRPESAAEADFVRRFCSDLRIDFACRRIDEVTRGVTARDEYERVSRRARYDLYRQTVREALERVPECREVGVVLGHHRGDLRENVLSNAHRGCGPLDLSGMTAVSLNDGVTLYRPLLEVEKAAVYDYAHKFGVPYFKDTTPHWSTRGKLRNKLLPLLEEIYGEGSMNNLSSLAVESDACRTLVHNVAFGPFLKQVQYKPMGITFATHSWKHYDLFFWKFVLREALHSAGLGMFSEKSVATFLERVQATDIREGWLPCRKDYATYLRQDGQVFVLYPTSFPWSTSPTYNTANDDLSVGMDHGQRIGPWLVQAHVVETTDDRTASDLLARKAVTSMEAFMDGHIEYFIKARTWNVGNLGFAARPLLFTSFTKSSRPLAWKSIDPKIQEKLPLLGCDGKTLSALKDPFGTGAVHTDAKGDFVENPIVLICVTLRLQ